MLPVFVATLAIDCALCYSLPMKIFMVAELLPYYDVLDHPGGRFSPGMGFESPNCDFLVYGPSESWEDFETDHQRLLDEGYECHFETISVPMI